MPVKRRISKVVDGRITPTTVAAYAHALQLRAQADRGEVDQMEVHEAERVVDRALNIRLWMTSVFDVHCYRDADERSVQLRQQLDQALAEATKQRQAAATAPTAA
jgi:hypothetical protein